MVSAFRGSRVFRFQSLGFKGLWSKSSVLRLCRFVCLGASGFVRKDVIGAWLFATGVWILGCSVLGLGFRGGEL